MDRNVYLKSLGGAIADRRRNVGLSQEDLASHAGLHRTYVGAVERGERNITVWNLVRLCEALDTDPCTVAALPLTGWRDGQ